MTPGEALDELERIVRARRVTASSAILAEPSLAYTDAYASLQLAYGHAKLGNAARSRELVAAARVELAPVIADPVHAYLLAAFQVRIAGYDGVLSLCDALTVTRGRLDRSGRYKADRLREVSWILSPIETVDPIGRWVAQLGEHTSPFAGVPNAERPDAIVASLSGFSITIELLDDALEALLGVAPLHAARVFPRIFDEIHDLPPTDRASLYAKAMYVADRANLDDLRTVAFDRARAGLAHAPKRAEVLEIVVPLASQLGLRRELAELVMTTDTMPAPAESSHEQIWLTACRAALGEVASALPTFDAATTEARRHPFRTTTALASPPSRAADSAAGLARIRSIVLATASLPMDLALGRIVALGKTLAGVTDDLGTLSHYSWIALGFFDSVVAAIVSCARVRAV